MAIDFPASPTNGQTFTSGSVTYTWDGTKWTAVAAAGSSNSISQGNTNATITDTGSDGRFVVTTEGSERLRVDSSGRVGIGTTSPAKPLEVRSASGIGQIRVGRSDSSTFNYDIGRDNDASGFLYFYGNQTGATGFVFSGADGERARIDSSGRLLVGTSTNYAVPATIAGPAAALTTGNGAYSVLSVADTNSMATGVGGGIAFQGNDGVNGLVAFSQVQGFKENSTSGNFAGGLSFSTRLNGASLAERARIDSSGRLGLGTASPYSLLDLGTSLAGQKLSLYADATYRIGLGALPNEFRQYTHDGGFISFGHVSTSNQSTFTERMRIRNDGRVAIGATTSAFNLVTIHSNAAGLGAFGLVDTSGDNVSRNIMHFARNADSTGNIVGTISTTNTSTSYNTSSDYRLKENVTLLTGATDRLKQLPVHRFNFITDPDKTVDGFLAHEAQAVVPECVTGEKDAVDADGNPIYQGIDQSKLVPLLTAALQEAIGEIESLKARVAALESPADPSTTNT